MPGRKQPILVTVEDIFSFGIFVRLEDGSQGYIRKRELSQAGDTPPREITSPGQQLQVLPRPSPEPSRIPEFSLRATLPDPWQQHGPQLQPGAVATGVVKTIVPSGVYVQVFPGLDGFIALEELAVWPVKRPEDLVWRGDRVEAVITQIDLAGRRLRLSIRRRLEQLQSAQVFFSQLQSAEPDAVPLLAAAPRPGQNLERGEERISSLNILVIEDQEVVREPLIRWLDGLGHHTQGEDCADMALEHSAPAEVDLILVDLDMPGLDGLSYIRYVRSQKIKTPIAVMSDPELIARSLGDLKNVKVAAVFPKPLDLEEMEHFLGRVAGGENVTLEIEADQGSSTPLAAHPIFQETALLMRSSRPVEERFVQGLEQLRNETRAEAAVLFKMDRASGAISLAAARSSLPLAAEAVYALVDSPIKDVIEQGYVIWEQQVTRDHQQRFRNLLALLPFEACVGAPVAAGGYTDYALFIFHQEVEAFSRYRQRDVLAMANHFAIALESQALEERIQSFSGLILSGQLSAGFGHEVANKLSGLDLQFRNLRTELEQSLASGTTQPPGNNIGLHNLAGALDEAIATAIALQQIVASFRGLMASPRAGSVSIETVLQQVEIQLRPYARRAGVNLSLVIEPGLPPALASPANLLQVFLNLGLNAIQQMELGPKTQRALEISARGDPAVAANGIQVRFADTGLGIHRQLWEKIFALGYTTRPDGSGLGLFIARSLVQAMGGAIRVEDSRSALGCTFLVVLPSGERQEAV